MNTFTDEFLRGHYGYGNQEDLSALRATHERLERNVVEAGVGKVVLIAVKSETHAKCHTRCNDSRWRFWMGVLDSNEMTLRDGKHELPISRHVFSDSGWNFGGSYGEPELREGNFPFWKTLDRIAFRWHSEHITKFALMIGDEEAASYPCLSTLRHAPTFDLVRRMLTMLGREDLASKPILDPKFYEYDAPVAAV